MSEYAIEYGVPMPKAPAGTSLYPFKRLSVNDSFFVPAHGKGQRKTSLSVSNAALRYKKKNPGTDFSVRVIEEAGVLGVRVWRTA